MASFTPRTLSAALETPHYVAALAGIERAFAQTRTGGAGMPRAPRSAPYCAPKPRAPQTTDEHHAEQNRQGLANFERNAILGAGLKPSGAEAADYLDRMAERLNGYLAQIDAAKCVLPVHLVGVDASDIALARDRLASRAARFANSARSAEAASDRLQRVGV